MKAFLKAKNELTHLLGKENFLDDDVTLALNSFDGSTLQGRAQAVINIKNTEQLAPVLKILNKYKVPAVARAAGTNHDGGCIPLKGGCILNLSPLNKILEIDVKEGFALTQCSAVNKHLQNKLEEQGFFFGADPASYAVSTLGGNCALNAGGPKTLKYGSAAANVLAAELITAEGEDLFFIADNARPNLLALMMRSEGTLSLISKLWLKILPKPKKLSTALAFFENIENTMRAVEQIIAAGILPSALEAMDNNALTISGLQTPQGARAMLIVENDDAKTAKKDFEIITEICRKNNALEITLAKDDIQRQDIWIKRRQAASCLAKIAPNLLSLDCTVPRSELANMIKAVNEIFEKYQLRGATVFHAGDGNLHPNIAFDENNLFEASRMRKAVKEINKAALALGGTLSGEHGIGIEKRAAMAQMFDENALNLFREIKKALDKNNILNPEKIIPLATESALKTLTPSYARPLAEIIKERFSKNETSYICGAKSKIKKAKYFPKDKNAFLDISALNQIVETDLKNYTIIVQAAAKVKDVASELAKQNLYLPIPSAAGTFGGIFAARTLPSLENYVCGLDFILPDGTFIRLGGKYVKNCAGYDLIRFLSGTFGAYALITQMTLRLFPFKAAAQKQNAFEIFKPNAYDIKLKKVFDKKNLFNPFIFKEKENDF